MSLLGGLASSPRAPLQSSRARMKKLPKKSQNEKYRLKYLRLRKAAKATVFVSDQRPALLRLETLLTREIFSPNCALSQSGSINTVLAFTIYITSCKPCALNKWCNIYNPVSSFAKEIE